MPRRHVELELVAEHVLADDGYLPGLRPRGHENVLSRAPVLPEDDALAAGDDVDERELEALLYDLMRREDGEEDIWDDELALEELPAERDAGTSRPRAEEAEPDAERHAEATASPERGVDPARVLRSALRDLRGAPESSDPEVRHNRRRLAAAFQGVDRFEPRNRHQLELRTVLIWLLEYMRRVCCQPGRAPVFEHWWAVAKVYARVLAAPEMATRKAWGIKTKLLELRANELTERRLQLILGRRKPPRGKRPADAKAR